MCVTRSTVDIELVQKFLWNLELCLCISKCHLCGHQGGAHGDRWRAGRQHLVEVPVPTSAGEGLRSPDQGGGGRVTRAGSHGVSQAPEETENNNTKHFRL